MFSKDYTHKSILSISLESPPKKKIALEDHSHLCAQVNVELKNPLCGRIDIHPGITYYYFNVQKKNLLLFCKNG